MIMTSAAKFFCFLDEQIHSAHTDGEALRDFCDDFLRDKDNFNELFISLVEIGDYVF